MKNHTLHFEALGLDGKTVILARDFAREPDYQTWDFTKIMQLALANPEVGRVIFDIQLREQT